MRPTVELQIWEDYLVQGQMQKHDIKLWKTLNPILLAYMHLHFTVTILICLFYFAHISINIHKNSYNQYEDAWCWKPQN